MLSRWKEALREFPPIPTLLLPQSPNGFNTSHHIRRELPQIFQNGSQPCPSEDQICPSECLTRSSSPEAIIPQTAPSPFRSEPQVILRASPTISTNTATQREPLQHLTLREAPPLPQLFLKLKTTSSASTPATRCCECWHCPNIGTDQSLIIVREMNSS